jgi:hypothetical protein
MMSEDDVSLETNAQFFLPFLTRFLSYPTFAIFSIFSSKIMLVYYGVAWFIMPSRFSSIFWAYQVYFIWHMPDVRGFRRVLYLALFDILPWDRVLFGLVHTGLPLIAYLFSAIIYKHVLQKPSLLWTVGWKCLKIILLALISAFLAVCTWLFVRPSVRERIKQVLSTFRQTTADMTAILMSYSLLFRQGRGHFLIVWWRIWERRADRQFHGNLATFRSQKWLEDTRDAKSGRRPFKYKPLEKEREIRLLEISMGEIRNIKAKMVHVDVDNPGEYSAISYTWGDNTKSHGIVIDEDWMATTSSVYDVIFKQAPINGTRRLWIDFVCINQDDNQEKARQVRLMREVYSSANKVIACLGNVDDEIADITEHYLRTLYANRKQLLKQPLLSRIITQQRKLFLGVRNLQWAAMSSLLKHPYWTRVWVIQEIANAKRLHILYGDREFSWDALHHLVVSTFSSLDTDPLIDVPELQYQEGESPLFGLHRIYLMMCTRDALQGNLSPPKALTLKDVLQLSRRFNATDKRDHVFALQGVLTEDVDKELLPDYTIEVEELFERVARHLLHQDDPFWIFAHAGISQPRNLPSLPSWVPDWSTSCCMGSADRLVDGPVRLGATSSQAQSFALADGILQLEGFYLGSILATAPTPMTDNFPDIIRKLNKLILYINSQSWLQVQEIVKAIPDPYMTGEPRDDALWRMFVGYTDTDEETMATDRELVEAWKKVITMPPDMLTQFEHVMERVRKSKTFFEKEKTMCDLDEVWYEYITASNLVNSNISNMLGFRGTGRVVAVTDRGYMALVPNGTKSNDKIYLVAGAHIPHVIREESPRFRLVGEACVHGLAADDARIVEGCLLEIT